MGQFNDVFWQQLFPKLFSSRYSCTHASVLLTHPFPSLSYPSPNCLFFVVVGFLLNQIGSLMGHVMWLQEICASTTKVALQLGGNKCWLVKGNWNISDQQKHQNTLLINCVFSSIRIKRNILRPC